MSDKVSYRAVWGQLKHLTNKTCLTVIWPLLNIVKGKVDVFLSSQLVHFLFFFLCEKFPRCLYELSEKRAKLNGVISPDEIWTFALMPGKIPGKMFPYECRVRGSIVGKKRDLGILDPMIFSGKIRKNRKN